MATGPCAATLGARRIAMMETEEQTADRSSAATIGLAIMLVLQVGFVLGLGAFLILHLL
jgi:hypothetical protein